ncbi:unnamed protein product [Gemmata massiliana]|uniref:Uncharacterized protein n=1 Tax=Gemmata massiliana TaxID=1210884 RepID=A0A6P2D8T4_9BACT|nr:unnamed protein product [Gemmata massiliana]
MVRKATLAPAPCKGRFAVHQLRHRQSATSQTKQHPNYTTVNKRIQSIFPPNSAFHSSPQVAPAVHRAPNSTKLRTRWRKMEQHFDTNRSFIYQTIKSASFSRHPKASISPAPQRNLCPIQYEISFTPECPTSCAPEMRNLPHCGRRFALILRVQNCNQQRRSMCEPAARQIQGDCEWGPISVVTTYTIGSW